MRLCARRCFAIYSLFWEIPADASHHQTRVCAITADAEGNCLIRLGNLEHFSCKEVLWGMSRKCSPAELAAPPVGKAACIASRYRGGKRAASGLDGGNNPVPKGA